jgi:hypothetical protein
VVSFPLCRDLVSTPFFQTSYAPLRWKTHMRVNGALSLLLAGLAVAGATRVSKRGRLYRVGAVVLALARLATPAQARFTGKLTTLSPTMARSRTAHSSKSWRSSLWYSCRS